MNTGYKSGKQISLATFFSFAIIALFVSGNVLAQLEPINQRPNPFSTVDHWATLPDGREWGSTAGVDMDPDGRHLWAIDRCGSE